MSLTPKYYPSIMSSRLPILDRYYFSHVQGEGRSEFSCPS